MVETDRLTDDIGLIDLSFVQRARTSREILQIGIRHHLAGLSLSNTGILLEEFIVRRSRTAIHNWVKKADLGPAGDESPGHVAVDQKQIRVNDDEYWLYAAVALATRRSLHFRLFPTYSIPISGEFVTELAEKHDVEEAIFFINDAREVKGALRREGLKYRIEIFGLHHTIERVFREVERRTTSFSNCFSHAEPATANSRLQAFATWWNQWLR